MVRARAALAAGVVGLVLVVSACAGDPAPKIPEARASAPSTSASSDAMSPEETVRAWIDAQNLALKTGNTDAARRLSTLSCRSCDGLLDPIEDVYRKGGYFQTQGWHVEGTKLGNSNADSAVVNTAVTIRGGKTLTAKDQQPVLYGSDRTMLRFRLRMDRDRWKVSFIGFLS